VNGEAVLELIERNGLPVVMAIGAVALLWRFGGVVLRAPHTSRVKSLEVERDHFRDRSEASEDRTAALARELIDECRVRAGGPVGAAVAEED
jgi:hypothetical protein